MFLRPLPALIVVFAFLAAAPAGHGSPKATQDQPIFLRTCGISDQYPYSPQAGGSFLHPCCCGGELVSNYKDAPVCDWLEIHNWDHSWTRLWVRCKPTSPRAGTVFPILPPTHAGALRDYMRPVESKGIGPLEWFLTLRETAGDIGHIIFEWENPIHEPDLIKSVSHGLLAIDMRWVLAPPLADELEDSLREHLNTSHEAAGK